MSEKKCIVRKCCYSLNVEKYKTLFFFYFFKYNCSLLAVDKSTKNNDRLIDRHLFSMKILCERENNIYKLNKVENYCPQYYDIQIIHYKNTKKQ